MIRPRFEPDTFSIHQSARSYMNIGIYISISVMLYNQNCMVRFEVFTAVTMKNAVFCDVSEERRFTQYLHGVRL
jgi:hypothetical protein